jgi:hypothetical protein
LGGQSYNQQHIDQNGGYVHPNYKDFFYLVIDIKTEASATYAVLRDLLGKYSSIISVVTDSRDQPDKPVKVLLSGNRPIEELLANEVKYTGLDGMPTDLQQEYPISFMPLISDYGLPPMFMKYGSCYFPLELTW